MAEAISQLCSMEATELSALLRGRQLSAVEVLEAHLERIAEVNETLNAIVTLVPDKALDDARQADRLAARPGELPLLHGMPIAIKDLEATEGIRTTQGSPIYAADVPVADSPLVARLKHHGVIVLGKTNTPEFGAGSQTFNRVFGATRNPYDPDRTAGGSSGGAAAAVASFMIPFADGSDLGGSLRNPASFCNVVGLRPSPGRVPETDARDGWDPMSVHGPIARSVASTALLLRAMSGEDARSPLSFGPALSLDGDLPTEKEFRVAWSRRLGGLPVDPAVTAVLDGRRAQLVSLGWVVEDAEPDFEGVDEAFEVLRALSFVGSFAELFPRERERLKDTIVWNISQGLELAPARIARALELRTEMFRRMRTFLEDYDVLAAPAAQVPPFPVEIEWVREIGGRPMGHYLEWMRACSRITVTGHPAVSVPAGFTADGLPVGLQLVGHYREEERLLAVAAAFEAVTRTPARPQPWRRGPGTVQAT